jgi:predicted RNA methylase
MKSEHLRNCQVETPQNIVDIAWTFAVSLRPNKKFKNVIDLGAGDARFSKAEHAYDQYTGIEFDREKTKNLRLPRKAKVIVADAMDWKHEGYDLCIGNPPYIRHHNLDAEWRDKVLARIRQRSGVSIKKTANLFVLFLMEGLLQTSEDGVIVQIIPFEWVTRPSAREVRDFITKQGWNVSTYRFNVDIFPTVLTTASLTIIDKSRREGVWKYGEIGINGEVSHQDEPSGGASKVLSYQNRDEDLHALRGLSPGAQEIFVLTEEERLHFALKKRIDVAPCVTSLRALPTSIHTIDPDSFQKYFVEAGRRCWLIRSDRETLTPQLQAYLNSVGNRWNQFSTCTNREVWSRYRMHPAPTLLFSSGFVGKTPKITVNSVKAIAVGSVYGVFATNGQSAKMVANKLRQIDFEECIVGHSNNLKKIEVRQLNTVLANLKIED